MTSKAKLTCPECGFVQVVEMPTDACQFFYQCVNCCVFCSYADVPCPPQQLEQLEKGKNAPK